MLLSCLCTFSILHANNNKDSSFTSINSNSLWGFNETDLEPNPNIHWGHTNNGLRYAIYPHKGATSMRLLVDMGSIMEDTTEEEGFVDFLEKYFTHKYEQTSFNAYAVSDFQSTIYSLNLSGSSISDVEAALSLLAQHIKELSFEIPNLECLSDRLLNDEFIFEEEPNIKKILHHAFLFSGSQLARKSSLLDFTPDAHRLKAFLEHWHTPDRMTLFITGDIDPSDLKSKIQTLFGELPGNNLYYRPDPIINPHHSETDAYVFVNPETTTSKIIIETLSRQKNIFDNKIRRHAKIMRELEEILVKHRLELARDESAALINVSVQFENYLNEFDIRRIKLESTPDHWKEAVDISVQKMLEIVYQDAFSTQDFDRAKEALIAQYEHKAAQAEKQSNAERCNYFVEQAKKKHIITSEQYNLNLLKDTLEGITVQDCNDELLDLWNTQQCYLIAEGNIGIEDPDEALNELVQAYLNSIFKIKNEFLETLNLPNNFATPRTDSIANRVLFTPLEHLGILQTSLSNGVHLNIALNHINPERVLVALRFGRGLLNESPQTQGMHLLADYAFIQGGLEKYSASSIQHILEVLNIQISFETTEDAFIIKGECNPESVKTLFQLLYAFYAEPNYNEVTFLEAKTQIKELYANTQYSPENILNNQGRYYLYGTNSEFKFPPEETLLNYSLTEFQNWFSNILQTSSIEVSVVGSFDPDGMDDLIQSFQSVFGFMDNHPSVISSDYEKRTIPLKLEQKNQTLYHQGDKNEALTRIAWPTCDGWNKPKNRKLRILSEIFSNRIKQSLNREFKDAHHANIESLNSLAFYNLGCIQIDLSTDVKDASDAERLITNEANKLLESTSISYEDFSHKIKPKLDTLANLRPNIWESKTKDSLEAYIESHIRPIAEVAQQFINTAGISYETLRTNMPEQVGYLTKVAYKLQQFTKNKDELEADFNNARNDLLESIQSLNPKSQGVLETEKLIKPTLNTLVQAKQNMEKSTGLQARSNLKRWFLTKTNDLLQKLKSLAEMNGIIQDTPPKAIEPFIALLRSIPHDLPSNDNEAFFALFKEKADLQAETIQELIKAINEHSLHIYGDVTQALTPHLSDFKQIAQNLSFQEKSVSMNAKTIKNKTQALFNRIWSHNPIVDDINSIKRLLEPKITTFLEHAKTLYQYTELELELEEAKNVLIEDAWRLLNPYQITPLELREAIQSIKMHLEQKSNTPEYWLNNVLIGSHYYPQKLDWAPCLLSDYEDVTIQNIESIIKQYMDPRLMHVIRVLPAQTGD